ncbi:hypothetical protein BH24DEI2_BH24DEI2_07530 [soil metagenome]
MAHWFALYYLPPADDELYRLGSAVLGYDVRAGKSLEPSPGLLGALGGVPDAWVADARDFGFHLTVTEAMTYEPAGLSRIADEIAEILRSFDPASELSLTFDSLQRWRGEQVVGAEVRAEPCARRLASGSGRAVVAVGPKFDVSLGSRTATRIVPAQLRTTAPQSLPQSPRARHLGGALHPPQPAPAAGKSGAGGGVRANVWRF